MALGGGSDATLGTGSSIGRYFSIVSVVPSVLLAVWTYGLVAAGAVTDGPSLEHLAKNNPINHPGYAAAAVAAAFFIALVGHPLQFALVQYMEGYWPNTRVSRRVRTAMVMGHLKRVHHAYGQRNTARSRRNSLPETDAGDLNQYLAPMGLADNLPEAREVVDTQADIEAWASVEGSYPSNRLAVLPTMLGNTLRKHEEAAGAAVNLPILKWASHISMVADPAHTRYVNDQRTQVDLAVRVSASAYIAAITTFLILWPKGWPVLLTLIPYALGYLAYKGSVVAANGYGAALHAWVDLNRFRLYEQLGLAPPTTADAERNQNEALVDLLVGNDTYTAQFQSAPAKPKS